jgi:hypothetical protein
MVIKNNKKYTSSSRVVSKPEVEEPVIVNHELAADQTSFVENFAEWQNYFTLTSYDSTRITGNYGEIKEVVLKRLDTDAKIKQNFYGPLLSLDLRYKYQTTF